jgi:hypothetical protein
MLFGILICDGVEAIDLATFGVLAATDASPLRKFSHPYSPLRTRRASPIGDGALADRVA